MRIDIWSLSCAALFLVPSALLAQPGPGSFPPVPRNVFIETVTFPASDTSLVRVDVHYRIEKNFFVSERRTEPGILGKFQRVGEVMAEMSSPEDNSHMRKLDRITIEEDSPPEAGEGIQWVQGAFSFEVKPGQYRLFVEASDLQSDQRFTDRTRSIVAQRRSPDSLLLAGPLLLLNQEQQSDSEVIEALNYGGDVLYGSPAVLYLEIASPSSESTADIDYALTIIDRSEDLRTPFATRRNPGVKGHATRRLVPVGPSPGPVRYKWSDSTAGTIAFLLPFPADTMLLRPYELELTASQGDRNAKRTLMLRVVWPDQPASLRDVDYALKALRYMVSGHVLDSLSSGSFTTRRDNLENFWSTYDQTPKTPYNELMTHYYRRVDYASKQFGTLRQPDGMSTDRGRIYILYGPPSTTERSLDPARGHSETWVYEKLRRTFVFVDRARNGTYTLETGSE